MSEKLLIHPENQPKTGDLCLRLLTRKSPQHRLLVLGGSTLQAEPHTVSTAIRCHLATLLQRHTGATMRALAACHPLAVSCLLSSSSSKSSSGSSGRKQQQQRWRQSGTTTMVLDVESRRCRGLDVFLLLLASAEGEQQQRQQ